VEKQGKSGCADVDAAVAGSAVDFAGNVADSVAAAAPTMMCS
jgi:hypothetical protein